MTDARNITKKLQLLLCIILRMLNNVAYLSFAQEDNTKKTEQNEDVSHNIASY